MKRLLFSLGVLAVFASCNNPQPAARKAPLSERNTKTENRLAANPANPYDSIGIWHNITLDSLRQHVMRNKDITPTGKRAYLQHFFRKYRHTEVVPAILPMLETRIIKDYKSVLFELPLSTEAKGLLIQLIEVLENIQTIDDYPGYRKQIVALENLILQAQLKEKEKSYLLVTTAMLRHSGYYWMKTYSAIPEDSLRTNGFLRKVLGVIAAVGSDATAAAYHHFKGTSIDGIIFESGLVSELCGYYTGWFGDK